MHARNSEGLVMGLLKGILSALTGSRSPSGADRRAPSRSTTPATTRPAAGEGVSPGQTGATATIEIDPPARDGLVISYAPVRDGAPDAGEVVWTWVPYEERDGRGKDRPVLIIGHQSAERVFAVRLTSKAHDGNRNYLPIGAGPWDSQGRPSWLDIEQVYSVHVRGMRREAAALERARFATVADALHRRYGWGSRL